MKLRAHSRVHRADCQLIATRDAAARPGGVGADTHEPKNALVCRQHQRHVRISTASSSNSRDRRGAIADQAVLRETGARGLRAIMEQGTAVRSCTRCRPRMMSRASSSPAAPCSNTRSPCSCRSRPSASPARSPRNCPSVAPAAEFAAPRGGPRPDFAPHSVAVRRIAAPGGAKSPLCPGTVVGGLELQRRAVALRVRFRRRRAGKVARRVRSGGDGGQLDHGLAGGPVGRLEGGLARRTTGGAGASAAPRGETAAGGAARESTSSRPTGPRQGLEAGPRPRLNLSPAARLCPARCRHPNLPRRATLPRVSP